MSHTLDLNGMLVATSGDKIPCKLVDISDEGHVELYAMDPVLKDTRFQLVIAVPRMQAVVRIDFVESTGDSYFVKAIPEGGIDALKAKIIEQRIRGLIR